MDVKIELEFGPKWQISGVKIQSEKCVLFGALYLEALDMPLELFELLFLPTVKCRIWAFFIY